VPNVMAAAGMDPPNQPQFKRPGVGFGLTAERRLTCASPTPLWRSDLHCVSWSGETHVGDTISQHETTDGELRNGGRGSGDDGAEDDQPSTDEHRHTTTITVGNHSGRKCSDHLSAAGQNETQLRPTQCKGKRSKTPSSRQFQTGRYFESTASTEYRKRGNHRIRSRTSKGSQ